MKKDDFKFKKDDVEFWKSQTKDLKNKARHSKLEIDESEEEDDFLELKAGSEELLKFRKIEKESLTTLPDLTLDKSSVGLDKNTNKKFKTGKMPVEAKLDMHGMTQDVAFNAMISFINSSYEQGKRCVVVVTGKGFFSKGGGVLKQSLPIWVNNPDIRPKILSFCQISSKPGGTGRYYIFLKRKK